MKVTHILVDDSNPLHRELPINRSGRINTVRLSDSDYRTYSSLEVSAHDMAALFHYGVIEALNDLRFISETGKGLDSWDEAFLSSGQIPALLAIVGRCIEAVSQKEPEKVLLGWHEVPEHGTPSPAEIQQGIAYWREIDPAKTRLFLENLGKLVSEAHDVGYDLEFML